jgi:glycerate dehydrogenase
MERIVFLDRESVRAKVRRPSVPHEWIDYASTRPEEVEARVQGATIVVVNKVKLPGTVLARVPNLKLVACAATGTDNVDVAWCKEHGVAVANIRGYAVGAVPEHTLMLMLALRRQLVAYRADVLAGKWQQAPNFAFFDHRSRELRGSTLGLVGRGVLGQAVAHLGSAFGMRILWGERKGAAEVRDGYVSFERLLAESDVVSLHCPSTRENRGLIGEVELRMMKPDALLINTARGGLVDEGALLEALRQGRIGGAGLDVLSVEPPREGNVLLDVELPNLIITPHVAWTTDEALENLATQLIDNIEAFVRGESRNRVV